MTPTPPTSRLPPIRKINSCPISELSDALIYLRHIFSPEVRGSHRRRPVVDQPRDAVALGTLKYPMDSDSLTDLRSDVFEQSYAIRWLTALISQTESWESDTHDKHDSLISSSLPEREALIQDAASLLAICSGPAAAGVVIRDFAFISDRKSGTSIKILIKDVPLDNGDYGSVGAQTWGGACVLAETIVDDPASFGLHPRNGKEIRILELGAGTGLVSLTVAKLMGSDIGQSRVTIIATDYYPPVLENLDYNIRSNAPFDPSDLNRIRLSSHFLDWSLFAQNLIPSPPFDTPFDLVLGADIVYEAQHALWIKACLTRLLQKPAGNSHPTFHLMVPLRSTHASESRTVETVFSPSKTSDTELLELRIISRDTIVCDAGNGQDSDPVEYAHYKIGWG